MLWWQCALAAGISALMAMAGTDPWSVLRHAYLIPTLWAAFTTGALGGGLVGLLAGLLHALLALPAVERVGLTEEALDGVISLGTPLGIGWVVGRLVDRTTEQAGRLRAVLEVQRVLNRESPLEESLAAVAERIKASLGADRVGLAVGTAPDDVVVAGAPALTDFSNRSAAAWVLRSAQPLAVSDLSTDPRCGSSAHGSARPLRGLCLPLDSGSGPVGVLAVERAGDLGGSVRSTAEAIAMHLALGIENVRLTRRQRRFAEELEDKVAGATRRLRELDQARTDFLSVVAHELRTPLTALQGFSELLLTRALPPERASRFLAHIHAEAGRLGRIVADLLDLSRIDAARGLELRREEIDLSELIERNVDLFATEHSGHRFTWALSSSLPAVRVDRDAMDRMLKNLLSNAVKYSPGGGRVAVAAGQAAERPGMLELSVEDDGVGIATGDLPRIFDRYVRISNPETASARGLGLGLNLVRALVEAHGGTVEVESRLGKGSRFRLLLPTE